MLYGRTYVRSHILGWGHRIIGKNGGLQLTSTGPIALEGIAYFHFKSHRAIHKPAIVGIGVFVENKWSGLGVSSIVVQPAVHTHSS